MHYLLSALLKVRVNYSRYLSPDLGCALWSPAFRSLFPYRLFVIRTICSFALCSSLCVCPRLYALCILCFLHSDVVSPFCALCSPLVPSLSLSVSLSLSLSLLLSLYVSVLCSLSQIAAFSALWWVYASPLLKNSVSLLVNEKPRPVLCACFLHTNRENCSVH